MQGWIFVGEVQGKRGQKGVGSTCTNTIIFPLWNCFHTCKIELLLAHKILNLTSIYLNLLAYE